MEKQSFISGRQAVIILLLAQLPYSTAFIPNLQAGNSVQDILLAVPANFILNFIVAIPILLLMKRYPGKDILEIADGIGGRGLTAVLAVLYMAGFFYLCIWPLNYFQQFYVNSIIPESHYFGIIIPLLAVCLYASIKGIEGIARFGTFVLFVYLFDVLLIGATVFPQIHLENLLPQFYNGPKIFEGALLSQANTDYQIVLLLFLTPFLHSFEKPGRLFARWNVIAAVVLLYVQFMVVTVLGSFGSEQIFPVYALSRQSGLGVFDRLEAVEYIAWIVETIFEISAFLYMAHTCLIRLGLNTYRRTVNFVLAGALLGVGWVVSRHVFVFRNITRSPFVLAGVLTFVFVIPLIMLLAGAVHGKAGQTP